MRKIKGDLLWALALTIWIVMLVVPTSRTLFLEVTKTHPYLGGFIKFAILASMGDLLGVRILTGEWRIPVGFLLKAVVWGIIGMMIALVFTIFTGGAEVAQNVGKLPFAGVKIAQAFFGSAVMNLTFGPMMYIYHKFGDLCVDHFMKHRNLKFNIDEMIEQIDWKVIVKFSWLTTCIWIWIPCHTIVFLLPTEFQVLVSAFLSILLGILMAISKKKQNQVSEV
ncbi:hypothetical protein [Fusibacter sp. 3D3]|uniref:hypothetical protein n=1 Tax=Fusibacter sp. 3D3 TaxID=1048380 RepID=UPI0008529154|nr:hypothetical protein [Fusibacter sp. 3D3]GAU76385.1 hypothetical protein F3D3_0982 [Fusibacter sp. 3D3]